MIFQEIKRDDAIFFSEPFKKDSTSFAVMESILLNAEKYPAPKIFSNFQNCVIVNSDPEHAVIVWTTDDFHEKEELYNFIKNEFCSNKIFKIMAKKNFYDALLSSKKIPPLDIQTLGVYSCNKLNNIFYIGHPDQATAKEVKEVAQMVVDFHIETGENKEAKLSDYLTYAQDFVTDPNFKVWRDECEKIVAIANNRINDRHPRIGCVYTKKEERGKSYAKMLVHYLTCQTLAQGKTAMLYTNFDYEPSNRCYQAIGYRLKNTIVNFIPPM